MLESHIFLLAEIDTAMLQIFGKKWTNCLRYVGGINNYLDFRHLVSLQIFWFPADSNSMESMIFLTRIIPSPPFLFSLITSERRGSLYSKRLNAFPESLISKVIFCLSWVTSKVMESFGLQA